MKDIMGFLKKYWYKANERRKCWSEIGNKREYKRDSGTD